MKEGSRLSGAMTTEKEATTEFSQIWSTNSGFVSGFLWHIDCKAPGHVLRVHYSKGESAGQVEGFFNEAAIIEMLEEYDYGAVDMVSPFIGRIVDQLCGLY